MTRKQAKRTNLTDSQYLTLRSKILFRQNFRCLSCPKKFSKFNHGSYELHHKNGNAKDNWQGNLEILCPECHAEADEKRNLAEKVVYVLDTETTGLDGSPDDFVVEIAICKVNLNTLKVEHLYSSVLGYNVEEWEHWQRNAWIFSNSDITLEQIKNAKPHKQVIKEVQQILKSKIVTSYNVEFDFYKFLSRDPWNIQDYVKKIANCLMIAATNPCGIPFYDYYGQIKSFKWPSLNEAYSILVEGDPALINGVQSHRARDDTLMASYVLIELYKRKLFDF